MNRIKNPKFKVKGLKGEIVPTGDAGKIEKRLTGYVRWRYGCEQYQAKGLYSSRKEWLDAALLSGIN